MVFFYEQQQKISDLKYEPCSIFGHPPLTFEDKILYSEDN